MQHILDKYALHGAKFSKVCLDNIIFAVDDENITITFRHAANFQTEFPLSVKQTEKFLE